MIPARGGWQPSVDGLDTATSQPPLVTRVLGDETGLASQQLNCKCVGHHHDDHWNVEGDQRAEHPECSVVDNTDLWLWHYIQWVV